MKNNDENVITGSNNITQKTPLHFAVTGSKKCPPTHLLQVIEPLSHISQKDTLQPVRYSDERFDCQDHKYTELFYIPNTITRLIVLTFTRVSCPIIACTALEAIE